MINNHHYIRQHFGPTVLTAAEALDEIGSDQLVLDVLGLAALAGLGDKPALYRAAAMASIAAQAVWMEVGRRHQETYVAVVGPRLGDRLKQPLPTSDRLDRLHARKEALNALIEAIRLSPEIAKLGEADR